MEMNIILAGVGGQGILSIAYVIDNAALSAGLDFKQTEVHGMAQRGGAVQSHLRYSDRKIYSALIPTGRADILLSVEPLEVMRYWHYLKPDGWIVTSVTPYVNIPDYPVVTDLLTELTGCARLVMVDSAQLARAAGNLRAQNMALLGAASLLLNFQEHQMLRHVESVLAHKGEKLVAVNQRALRLGRAAAGFFRGLVDQGVQTLAALRLCRKLATNTLELQPACQRDAILGLAQARLEQLMGRAGELP